MSVEIGPKAVSSASNAVSAIVSARSMNVAFALSNWMLRRPPAGQRVMEEVDRRKRPVTGAYPMDASHR
jgi:hypothetical protein